MAELFVDLAPSTQYWDKKSGLSRDQYVRKMNETATVYVGNLSFYTTEEQIFELFNKVGEVSRVIMGLNRVKRTPCGFCFVEFFSHEAAGLAVNLLTHSVLDDRTIRVDWDAGFVEGRQYGRGQTGDQWRDDLRDDFDPARGGQGRGLLRTTDDGHQIFLGQRPPAGPPAPYDRPPAQGPYGPGRVRAGPYGPLRGRPGPPPGAPPQGPPRSRPY
jgi:nuclear cap-binding protein subunit 2